MKNEHWVIVLVVGLALILGGVRWFAQPKTAPGVHIHADFAVFINNERVDFAQEKFMSTEQRILSERTHLHDLDANVIHIHESHVTLKEFFESINMRFSKDCFGLDTGEQYCTDSNRFLLFFVNRQANSQFENYEPNDLDQILISYGTPNSTQLQDQLNAVSDTACIYSEKCPERGSPPPESCTPGKCIS